MKDSIIGIVVVAGTIGFLIWSINSSIEKGEIVQCRKWQEQSAQFNDFYLVKWQADQCASHNITINAPVK